MIGGVKAAGLIAAVALLGGVAETAAPAPDWRRIATSADRTRLRNWRATWLLALTAARAADAAGVAREGQLFEPDRALASAIPPAGAYRCRTFKLGGKAGMPSAFTAYPTFDCRIDDKDGVARFAKASGSQRPAGLMYPDGTARAVFLGTLALGDESRAMAYGRDATRDMAGLVERIGPRRWRIVFPEPRFESQLDVVELVPAD